MESAWMVFNHVSGCCGCRGATFCRALIFARTTPFIFFTSRTSDDRNPAVPEEAWPASGPRDRPGTAYAPRHGEATPHGPGRKPGGGRLQDHPIRERPEGRSVAGPHLGVCPAAGAGSKAQVEGVGRRVTTGKSSR